MKTIKWQKRHEDALNTLVKLRVNFISKYAEAREREDFIPHNYVYSIGELAIRFGLPPRAFSQCCAKTVGESDVDLDVVTAIMSLAEHAKAIKCYAGFTFYSYRTKRLMESSKDRDPTMLLVRIQPVAKKLGSTVPEAMEVVRNIGKIDVSKDTVRRWCSNSRPLHIKDEVTYTKFLNIIESLRDEKEVDAEPTRKRFSSAFKV